MPVNEIEDDVDDDDVFDDESDVEELRTSTSFEGDDRRRITFVSLLSLLDMVNNVDKFCGYVPRPHSFFLSFLFSSTPVGATSTGEGKHTARSEGDDGVYERRW
jgi:hypothetical protein